VVTVGGGATALASPPARATLALVQVLGGDARYWVDGTNPTGTTGYLAVQFARVVLRGQDEITGFSAVAVGPTVSLQVAYWQGTPDPVDLALLTAGS
jgi:hypothetical protein